ncbi:MAG TPA: twin-arginine translocase TatA/TatE family subunit [Candidatus Methylomirabilis sp.]|nr:twin-arginine translocase TatA/TatE family subunit [Candidatus Methylomirabilis sp.]
MFGVGMPELMIIFVIALLVFGPKELPKIARTLGKAMSELRRASDELRDGIQREIDIATREEKEPPPSPAEAVPSSPMAETSLPPSDGEGSVQADGQGAETAVVEWKAGPEEHGVQEVAGTTLPTPEGQSTQPAAPEAVTPPELPAEPAQAHATPEEIMKATEQAAPVETPKKASTTPETVSHVPAQPVETRNA